MKKSVSVLLFIIITCFLDAQVYKGVMVLNRANKSFSINSIEILKNNIKVNIEYLGSSRQTVGYMNILSDTKIIQNGKEGRLLKTQGIEISPRRTMYKPNEFKYFTLIFEKPVSFNVQERFDIIEKGKGIYKYPWAINFIGVSISEEEIETEFKKFYNAKNDYFLSQIPNDIQFIFYYKLFLHGDFNSRKVFDRLLEYLSNQGKHNQINKIDMDEDIVLLPNNKVSKSLTFENDVPVFKYLLYPNNMDSVSEFVFRKDNTRSIDNVNFIFLDKEKAWRFFKSICDWYGVLYQEYSDGNAYGEWTSPFDIHDIFFGDYHRFCYRVAIVFVKIEDVQGYKVAIFPQRFKI